MEVLDTGDRRDPARLGELLGRDVGDARVTDQALLTQGEQSLQGLGQGGAGAVEVTHPQGHHVQAVHAEGAQVRLDGPAQPVRVRPVFFSAGRAMSEPSTRTPTSVTITRSSG